LRSSISAVSSGAFRPALTISLICMTAIGGMAAISPAISMARASAWPVAAISLTTPMLSASAAPNNLPVNNSSMARLPPTNRASFCVPPPPARMPSLTSGRPRRAPSPATMMSAHSANSSPPPSAKPSIAAITGFGQSMIVRQYFCTLRAMTSTGSASAISPMSAPAANALSEPVMIRQRIFPSAAWRVTSSASRVRTSRLSALRTCGRLSRSTTMASDGYSTRRTSAAVMGLPRAMELVQIAVVRV